MGKTRKRTLGGVLPEFEVLKGEYVVPPNIPGRSWTYDVDVYDISVGKYVAAVIFSAKNPAGHILWQLPMTVEALEPYRNLQGSIIQKAKEYAISHGVPVLAGGKRKRHSTRRRRQTKRR